MSGQIETPTGDRRHMTNIREGRISFEVFCQNPQRREEMGMLAIPKPDDLYDEPTGVTLPVKRPKKR